MPAERYRLCSASALGGSGCLVLCAYGETAAGTPGWAAALLEGGFNAPVSFFHVILAKLAGFAPGLQKPQNGPCNRRQRPRLRLHQSRRLRRSPLPLEVETPAGTVRGYADRVKGARTFLGVPFAAPPLGHLRFAY